MADETVPPVVVPGTTPAPVTPPVVPAPSESPAGKFVPEDRFVATVAQKYEAIRRAEAAEQRANALEERLRAVPVPSVTPAVPAVAPVVPTAAPAAPIREVDIDKLANERAKEIEFTNRCNVAVAEGRKAHGDFDASIAALRGFSPLRDGSGAPMLPVTFVEAALATGHGPDVMYALGKDSAEADRIMSLSPMAQAVELTKLAQKFAQPEPELDDQGNPIPAAQGETPEQKVAREAAALRANPSPAPIVPLSRGRGTAKNPADMDLSDPQLPMEEFVKRRNAEEKARREARFA